jgi:Helix-hairpin-helix domain
MSHGGRQLFAMASTPGVGGDERLLEITRPSCHSGPTMPTPDVRPLGDVPDGVGKTAARALSSQGIKSLKAVARWTEQDLLAIHGIGPKAIGILGDALSEQGLTFKE